MRAPETNAFRTSPLLLSVLSVMRSVGVPRGSRRPASRTSRARSGARTMTEGNASAHFSEPPPFSFLPAVPAGHDDIRVDMSLFGGFFDILSGLSTNQHSFGSVSRNPDQLRNGLPPIDAAHTPTSRWSSTCIVYPAMS